MNVTLPKNMKVLGPENMGEITLNMKVFFSSHNTCRTGFLLLPSLKLTAKAKAPENGWLDPTILVLGRTVS